MDQRARTALKSLKPEELKKLFAEVRRKTDAALLKEIHPAPTKPAKKAAAKTDLAADVTAMMKPLLASSAEKADLLAQAMGAEAKGGLAPTARALVKAFGEAAVRTACEKLMRELAAYSLRETVS
jgi:hypothetical protein